MTDLSTLRARFALARVNELNGEAPGQYVSFVKALPAAIIRNGLGQALAMEAVGKTKTGGTKTGHQRLYDDMEQWLLGTEDESWDESPLKAFAKNPANTDKKNLLLQAVVTALSEDDYVRVQVEALAYLEWLKKFAVAFLEKPRTDAADQAEGNV